MRALRERPFLGRIALAQGFYGGGLIAAAPLFALVHVDRLNLSLSDVGVIGILAAVATTVAFPIWGVDRGPPRARHGAPPRQRDRARWRSSATRSRRASSVLWLAALAAGIGSASIDVGIAAAVSDQTPLASRAAAMAGWNALTGARGIVAAFLMSALLQLGVVDVTVGAARCARSRPASGSCCSSGRAGRRLPRDARRRTGAGAGLEEPAAAAA